VILARGGGRHGYALYLDGGRPAAAVTTRGSTVAAAGAEPVTGRWARLTAVIGADRKLTLLVDGKPAAAADLPSFIEADPTEAMQIGADHESRVAPYPEPAGFTGLIESVRIHAGEPPAPAPPRADTEGK
jgi:hypothetical protein